MSPTSHYGSVHSPLPSTYNSPSYPHTPPPQSNGSGYLDPFTHISGLPDVMEMSMDPSLGMDLSILSAQEHRDQQILEQQRQVDEAHRRGKHASQRHHRGSSETTPEPTDPRGRGSTRKQRGRPRLDTKDENAADRRRTQIRLAQRAYRLRKETTISSLRTRVTELENAIDGMQQTFFQVYDSASKNSYSPEHNELKEQFMGFVRAALGPNDGTSSGEGEEDEHERPLSADSRSSRPRSRDDDDNGGTSTGQLGATSQPQVSAWGYQMSYTRSSSAPYGESSSSTHQNQSRATGTPTSYYPSPIFSSPSSFSSLPSPTTAEDYNYTLTTTSFSRHLHRAALQRSYTLLTAANPDEHAIARTMAYTLCYVPRAEIIATLQMLLSSNDSQSLYLSERPELLPRRRLEAFEDDLAAYQDSGRRGATKQIRGEAHSALRRLGVGQKYLRPDDVEAVLVDMGVISVTDSSAATDSGISDASSPLERYASTDSGIDNSELIFPKPHSRPATEEDFMGRGGKTIIGIRKGVSLDLFCKELIERGVCVGQYPAFRRGDVDAALKIATEPATMAAMVY
ncbi:hypothetical protein EDC01DRAFT_778808 [Geopyxis carbonaria]|nr:hypothetical protein EDC01DRAFT_778808 [Geopyxis carbonaria]